MFMLTHIVLFKLKDRSPENIHQLSAILKSMEGQIPPLRQIEVGVNMVESARAYDVALITRFDSLAAMKDYQAHPYHVANVLPHVNALAESVAAVDYETP